MAFKPSTTKGGVFHLHRIIQTLGIGVYIEWVNAKGRVALRQTQQEVEIMIYAQPGKDGSVV
ncbi:hypothetical protein, partial [Marinobacter sp.]